MVPFYQENFSDSDKYEYNNIIFKFRIMNATSEISLKKGLRKKRQDHFPRLKITFDGILLEHNVTAEKILKHWHCRDNEALPSNVASRLQSNMSKLKSNDSIDVYLPVNGSVLPFLLIPFPEAGYIGIYGNTAI